MQPPTNSPSKNLIKLASKLFSLPAQQEKFISAVTSGNCKLQSLVWLKDRPTVNPFKDHIYSAKAWQPEFIDLISYEARAGTHELHATGSYYMMEASSAFAASALQEIEINNPVTLDMCAAPGGKSIYAARLLKPEYLVCNETIRKRCRALLDNLERCEIQNYSVTSSDSSWFANSLPQNFDLVIVDAPCSGQSLLAKGDDSPGCFHESTSNLNKNRQRRILANSAQTLRAGGYLLYITCTYSKEENEETVAWLVKRFPELVPHRVKKLAGFESNLAEFPCYRLFPEENPENSNGAGAFACLLKSNKDNEEFERDRNWKEKLYTVT